MFVKQTSAVPPVLLEAGRRLVGSCHDVKYGSWSVGVWPFTKLLQRERGLPSFILSPLAELSLEIVVVTKMTVYRERSTFHHEVRVQYLA